MNKQFINTLSNLQQNLETYNDIITLNNTIKQLEEDLIYGKQMYDSLLSMFECNIGCVSDVSNFFNNRSKILSEIRSLNGILDDTKRFIDNTKALQFKY